MCVHAANKCVFVLLLLQWLKTARAEEAAVIADAPLKVQLLVKPDSTVTLQLQVWEPLPQQPQPTTPAADDTAAAQADDTSAADDPAAAGAMAGAAGGQQGQDAEENTAAGSADADAAEAAEGGEAAPQEQQQADDAAAAATAAAAAQEQLARQPLAFKPRLLEELVRFKRTNWTSRSSDGSNGGGSGKGMSNQMDVDPTDTAAGGSTTGQQQQQQQNGKAPTMESYLQECDDEWQPPGSISYLIVPLKDAAAGTSGSSGSSGQEDPQLIPAEAYPSLNIAAAGTAGHTSVLRTT
jgi:hypothetical protein